LYLVCSFILSQCRDLRTGVMWEDFGVLGSKRVLDVLEFFYLRLWKIIVQWVAVVKFRMNNRSGDGILAVLKSIKCITLCWKHSSISIKKSSISKYANNCVEVCGPPCAKRNISMTQPSNHCQRHSSPQDFAIYCQTLITFQCRAVPVLSKYEIYSYLTYCSLHNCQMEFHKSIISLFKQLV